MPEPLEHDRWMLHDREHESFDLAHRREHDLEEKARELASKNIEMRLAGLNELRQEVLADRALFMLRGEHAADMKAVVVRIETVEKLLNRAEGAVNTWRFIAGLLGVGGIGAVVWAIINTPT